MSREKTSTSVHFASRLQQMLADRGTTNAALAKEIAVSPTAVGNYVGGRIPKAEELHRLAEALGVTMEWLLTGEGPAPRAPAADHSGTLRGIRSEAEKLARQIGEAEATLARLRSFLG